MHSLSLGVSLYTYYIYIYIYIAKSSERCLLLLREERGLERIVSSGA